MKPSIGSIVHYRTSRGERPAIVTHVVSDETVNLMVFSDGSLDVEADPLWPIISHLHGLLEKQWHSTEECS